MRAVRTSSQLTQSARSSPATEQARRTRLTNARGGGFLFAVGALLVLLHGELDGRPLVEREMRLRRTQARNLIQPPR